MTKTKLEKLRDQVEEANSIVKESFTEYDKVHAMIRPDMTAIETSDHVLELVKTVVNLAENMGKALGAYSKYTAALEIKFGVCPKRNERKRKSRK